jgi:ABC-type glycerol-3-phosphate transport system substrate-binding protein
MRTRRTAALAVVAATAAALMSACSSSGGGGGNNDKVTLRFQSLAFQKPTVAAVAKIVETWNKDHPNLQVKLDQGSWDSVHDQLVTQFEGGTAPDIIHDDAADIAGFIQQGYLADLSDKLSSEVKKSVPKGVWDTVSNDGKIYAAPTLLQSYVVFANTDLLKADKITVPSGDTLSWDDLQSIAKQATTGGAHGLGWGLKSPTATMMTLGLNFDGTYFSGSGQDVKINVGDNENQVPQRIHAMAYDDKSIDPTSLTQSGTDVLPTFYAGKVAMVVGGNYVAQQISEQAPKNFHWAVLPPLSGTSANQAADPQVLAVSQASKHAKQAAQFIDYFMSADNLASVAQGDWLIPTTDAARQAVQKATGGASGWTQTLAGAQYMVSAPFQSATNYPRWKDQIATPAFQQYLADKISLDDLDKKLSDGWTQVNQ